MKKLTDNKQSLDWVFIDYEYDWTKEESRNFIKDELSQLNTWGSTNISKYISEMPLGDYMYDMCDIANDNYDTSQYFHLLAYEGNNLVGTSLIAINSKDIRFEFNDFTLPNNMKILFLIVNPEYQNLGIGTRMIKSIIENQDFFSHKSKTSGISTDIHNENISSQKAFLKNNFTTFTPPRKKPRYMRYFYIEKKEQNNNLEQL